MKSDTDGDTPPPQSGSYAMGSTGHPGSHSKGGKRKDNPTLNYFDLISAHISLTISSHLEPIQLQKMIGYKKVLIYHES